MRTSTWWVETSPGVVCSFSFCSGAQGRRPCFVYHDNRLLVCPPNGVAGVSYRAALQRGPRSRFIDRWCGLYKTALTNDGRQLGLDVGHLFRHLVVPFVEIFVTTVVGRRVDRRYNGTFRRRGLVQIGIYVGWFVGVLPTLRYTPILQTTLPVVFCPYDRLVVGSLQNDSVRGL